MKTQSILKTVLLAAGFSAFTLIGGAQAQVLLTGGDATDGWVAPADPVLAYALAASNVDPATITVQGLAFTRWDEGSGATAPTPPAGVTVSTDLTNGGFAGNIFSPPLSYAGGDTNDQAMAALMTGLEYNFNNSGTGPVTFSISGLAAGSYRLDEFYATDTNRNNMQFAINGTTVDTFNATTSTSYLVQNTVTVTGAGTLTFSVTDGSGGTAALSGFDLSSTPVEAPEPSTYALMGLGALALLVISRRRTA